MFFIFGFWCICWFSQFSCVLIFLCHQHVSTAQQIFSFFPLRLLLNLCLCNFCLLLSTIFCLFVSVDFVFAFVFFIFGFWCICWFSQFSCVLIFLCQHVSTAQQIFSFFPLRLLLNLCLCNFCLLLSTIFCLFVSVDFVFAFVFVL